MQTRRAVQASMVVAALWMVGCENKKTSNDPLDAAGGAGGEVSATGNSENAGSSGTSAAGGAGSGGTSAAGGAGSSGTSLAGGAGSGGTGVAGSAGGLGPSVGCGKTGAPTGVLNTQTIMVGNSSRGYVLSVPKTYVSTTAMPLVFAFHGMGGSGKVARQYFGVEAASQNGAIFVYPDGQPVNDAGSAGWDLSATGKDFAFFDTLLATLADTYCVDRNRVFAVGHSYGGLMTNAIGCYRGDVVRAIAPVAGMPPNAYGGSPKCVGSVAAIVVHGENDPTVDYTRGGIGARDFWRGRNGCSTETQPDSSAGCVDYTGCQPDLPVVWCVHTQAHDFPNGRCDAGACLNGGAAIWSFFKSFN